MKSPSNDIELTLLVNDRPITEYPHLGKVYVEGRAGSEYQIEVRNHSYQRIEAVLSVDGLSILDGKPAGMQSTGYVINAYDTLRVPGWTLDNNTVAKFAFAGKAASYATTMTGDSRNNGVIGAMVFREKPNWYYPTFVNTTYMPTSVTTPAPWATWNSTTTQNMGSITGQAMSSGVVCDSFSGYSAVTPPMVDQSLGTAFGGATNFATTNVSFTRAGSPVILTIYYDERRGLKARGIRIGRPFRPQEQPLPQAFPGIGCPPPPNWQG